MSKMWYGTQVIMMYVVYSSDTINITVHHCTAMVQQRYMYGFHLYDYLVNINYNIRMRRWKDSVPLVINIIMVISSSCYELSSNGFIQLYRTVGPSWNEDKLL